MLAGKALALLAPAAGIKVEISRCLHRRFARSTCRRCQEACASGALRIDKGPQIDSALCRRCRRCEGACPNGALQGDERSLEQLASALAHYPAPVLGCRAQGGKAHVHSDCLGFLHLEGLLALGLFFPEGLTLNLTRCHDCRNADILPQLEDTAKELAVLLPESVDRLRLAQTEKEVGYRDVDLSRREFFNSLRRRSAATASRAAARLTQAPPQPDGRRKVLPEQRRLLVRVLSLAPTERRETIEGMIFPQLRFTSSCTGCTGCAGVCPSGAINADDADPPKPVFSRHLCTGCKLCVELCRKGGVTLSRSAERGVGKLGA